MRADKHRVSNRDAPVAQLDRAPPSEGGGHTFESCRAPQVIDSVAILTANPVSDLSRGTSQAGSRSGVSQTSLNRHLLPNSLELELLKSRHCATRDMDVAILSGSESHLHKSLSTPTHSFFDLSAKAAVPDFRALAGVHLAVKSGRTLAAGLLFKLEGGERPCSETIAALADHRPVRV